MQDTPFQRTKEMLEIAHTEDTVFPPTELYNEGWMLRLALLCQSEGNECLPFALQPKAS
ncbi:MAG: hypothetical protein ACOC38_11425 [Promethearchaeia archaeon]